jgi:pimeloyl-ACP methyl ester carboxylesterase
MAAIAGDRRIHLLAVTLASGAIGVATGFVAPHGPATAAQALATMGIALATGLAAGRIGGSRWVLLPLWLAYVAGVELARLDVASPTIDAIRLDNAYGILAFVLGRGFHGLLTVLPMALGVVAGRSLAQQRAGGQSRAGRPFGTVALAIGVAALAVLVAWPASTPPVLGPDGEPIPGSIAELSTVRLGGRDHTIMVRAADPDAPVLLYLAGGPGQSDIALSRALTTGWVEDFVFVNLDQRGTGSSYAAIDPVADMTVERAVADVVELTEHLRERFGEEKVYLMGESWGTILGVLAVQQRPDLYHAWIGSGQMVDVVETDQRVYADLVAHAEATGDAALAAALTEIGEPPYRDIPWANANLLTWYDYLYRPYTPPAGYIERGEAAGLDPFGILGSEYDLVGKTNVLRGLVDTFALLYPQLYDVDLRRDVARLEVPVWILDGTAELDGRRDLTLEWYAMLEAPTKELVTYADAAHAVAFEQADAVRQLLNEAIVPATYRGGD